MKAYRSGYGRSDQFEKELVEEGGFSRQRNGGFRGLMSSIQNDIRAQEAVYWFKQDLSRT